MADRKTFVAKLTLVAEMCARQVSADLLVAYTTALEPIGFPALCAALDRIAMERNDRDPFPSIKTIRDLVAPPVNTDHDAIEAANRIVQAIADFGYYQAEGAKRFIGELGWLVVQREGGWETLCESLTTDQIPTRKAQWRELAKALIGRAQRGTLGTPPELPPSGGVVHSLAQRLSLERGAK